MLSTTYDAFAQAIRAVASLTVPGGQEFHFTHFFPSNFDQFFSFFLEIYLFSSSFWPLPTWESPDYAIASNVDEKCMMKPYSLVNHSKIITSDF